jgi:hypothetical protein
MSSFKVGDKIVAKDISWLPGTYEIRWHCPVEDLYHFCELDRPKLSDPTQYRFRISPELLEREFVRLKRADDCDHELASYDSGFTKFDYCKKCNLEIKG